MFFFISTRTTFIMYKRQTEQTRRELCFQKNGWRFKTTADLFVLILASPLWSSVSALRWFSCLVNHLVCLPEAPSVTHNWVICVNMDYFQALPACIYRDECRTHTLNISMAFQSIKIFQVLFFVLSA